MVDHQQDVAVPDDGGDDDGPCDSFVRLHFRVSLYARFIWKLCFFAPLQHCKSQPRIPSKEVSQIAEVGATGHPEQNILMSFSLSSISPRKWPVKIFGCVQNASVTQTQQRSCICYKSMYLLYIRWLVANPRARMIGGAMTERRMWRP